MRNLGLFVRHGRKESLVGKHGRINHTGDDGSLDKASLGTAALHQDDLDTVIVLDIFGLVLIEDLQNVDASSLWWTIPWGSWEGGQVILLLERAATGSTVRRGSEGIKTRRHFGIAECDGIFTGHRRAGLISHERLDGVLSTSDGRSEGGV